MYRRYSILFIFAVIVLAGCSVTNRHAQAAGDTIHIRNDYKLAIAHDGLNRRTSRHYVARFITQGSLLGDNTLFIMHRDFVHGGGLSHLDTGRIIAREFDSRKYSSIASMIQAMDDLDVDLGFYDDNGDEVGYFVGIYPVVSESAQEYPGRQSQNP